MQLDLDVYLSHKFCGHLHNSHLVSLYILNTLIIQGGITIIYNTAAFLHNLVTNSGNLFCSALALMATLL